MDKVLSQKGITLIALVITLIVLVLLSVVTIAMLFGDSGLLSTENTAKEETEKAAIKENINIAYMSALTRYYEDGTSIAEAMEEELLKTYSSVTVTETDGTYTVTVNGTEYTI